MSSLIEEAIDGELYSAVFKKKQSVYLYGLAGTGKSYQLKLIVQYCRDHRPDLNCHITSTTGVSAIQLGYGATTIHSFGGIGLGTKSHEVILKSIRRNKECRTRWESCHFLIIDEVSMLNASTFELLERVARDVRGSDLPFGGIQLLLSGDFLQLPPVKGDYAFQSEKWVECGLQIIKLTIPRRFVDNDYFLLLRRLRTGNVTKQDRQALQERCESYKKNQTEILSREIKPTFLYSLKGEVEDHNVNEMTGLKGKKYVYLSVDEVKVKGTQKRSIVPLNTSLIWNGDEKYLKLLDSLSPEAVVLKIGSQVMLTHNMSVQDQLVNGSRGVVKECTRDEVSVLFMSGSTFPIPRITREYEGSGFKIYRKQLPLILAWSITIHKSQGATLDYCVADLGSSIFGAGMSYVCLSRMRGLNGLYLAGLDTNKIYANKKALEFEEEVTGTKFYKEVFTSIFGVSDVVDVVLEY